ncbi:hypothetical protein [Pandoravirus japonicus]|uniref:Uncharacterized protein n=1 Tax=Pandoravirus japonicus TaxID=2823154 RepID=A0A811BQ12_9VIRU|nr:hypothetical protein [Pandoravirus japonicus]
MEPKLAFATTTGLFLLVAVAMLLAHEAVPAAGAECRCALAYGDPFWLYNRATRFFCGVACAPGSDARPCPVRCGPAASRPTPFTMVPPADYASVVVASPSLRCRLGATDNGTLDGRRRLCGPRSNGLVACAVAEDDDHDRRDALGRSLGGSGASWLVMVKAAAGSAIHDGDEIMLLAVPDGTPPLLRHLAADEPFSWCHADGEDQRFSGAITPTRPFAASLPSGALSDVRTLLPSFLFLDSFLIQYLKKRLLASLDAVVNIPTETLKKRHKTGTQKKDSAVRWSFFCPAGAVACSLLFFYADGGSRATRCADHRRSARRRRWQHHNGAPAAESRPTPRGKRRHGRGHWARSRQAPRAEATWPVGRSRRH